MERVTFFYKTKKWIQAESNISGDFDHWGLELITCLLVPYKQHIVTIIFKAILGHKFLFVKVIVDGCIHDLYACFAKQSVLVLLITKFVQIFP